MALKGYIKLKLLTLAVCLLGLVLFTPKVFSQAYGSGSYNSCKYGTSCPAASGSSGNNSTGSSTTPSTSSKIILNNYDNYFSDSGQQLVLKAGDVIYFDVTANGETIRYSLTVNKVGTDYVDITINPGGIKLRLFIGDTKLVDVNGDGINDISITLDGIKDGKATFTFKVLGATTQAPAAATTTPPKKSTINWLLWLSIAAIIIGALIWTILFIMRRRDKDNKPIQF